jgi:hypothetical protein
MPKTGTELQEGFFTKSEVESRGGALVCSERGSGLGCSEWR